MDEIQLRRKVTNLGSTKMFIRVTCFLLQVSASFINYIHRYQIENPNDIHSIKFKFPQLSSSLLPRDFKADVRK